MPSVQVTVDWAAVRADSVEFARTVLRHPDGSPFIPHTTQSELMRGIRRNTIAVTGRQWGKTTALDAYATWFGVTKPNRIIMILAPTVDQAKLIFNGILSHFTKGPLKRMVDGKPKSSPFPELKLNNGTVYMCRGLNSPQYVRGHHPHLVICDEGAFIKEGAIRDVVEPLLTVSGKEDGSALILISTPFGQGEFYQFWQTAHKKAPDGISERWAWYHYPSTSNPHADMEYLAEVKERYGEDSPVWQAEYLGNFQDDESQVFPTGDIKWAYENWPHDEHGNIVKLPILALDGHRYVQGVDLANRRDFFVASVLDATDKNRILLNRMDRFRRRGYEHYKRIIKTNYDAYNRARTILDATSLGESFVEEVNAFGVPAEGYTYSSNTAKHEVVQELARLLSEHRLVLPFDKDIITELSHFRYLITASKVLRMEAPKNEHDDIVMSLALGAHLACVPVMTGAFGSVDLAPNRPKRHTPDPFEGGHIFDEDWEPASGYETW